MPVQLLGQTTSAVHMVGELTFINGIDLAHKTTVECEGPDASFSHCILPQQAASKRLNMGTCALASPQFPTCCRMHGSHQQHMLH